jgi:DNA-directed RNA polymerase subunit RPC12/RpoP
LPSPHAIGPAAGNHEKAIVNDNGEPVWSDPVELKPFGFFVTLKYRCPRCGRGYFRTVEETQATADAHRCKCGAMLRHKPVDTLDIKVRFQSSTPTLPDEPS